MYPKLAQLKDTGISAEEAKEVLDATLQKDHPDAFKNKKTRSQLEDQLGRVWESIQPKSTRIQESRIYETIQELRALEKSI